MDAPADGEWSLLLASDGTKPAPSSISMTFPNDTSTPWAIPLMVIGGLLILAGLALLVLKPGPQARIGGGPASHTGSLRSLRRARAVRPSRPAGACRSRAREPPVEKQPGTSTSPRRSPQRAGVAVAALAATTWPARVWPRRRPRLRLRRRQQRPPGRHRPRSRCSWTRSSAASWSRSPARRTPATPPRMPRSSSRPGGRHRT